MKRCHKCNAKVKGFVKFCHECGAELKAVEKTIETTEKKIEKEIKNRKPLVFVIVSITLLAIVLFVFYVKIPYTAVEQYTEQEPYTDTEYYYDKEPYTNKECQQKDLVYSVHWGNIEKNCVDEECTDSSQVCVNYESICVRTESYCVDTNWLGNCIEYRDRCIEYDSQCTRYEDRCNYQKCTKYNLNCRLDIKNSDTSSGIWEVDTYVLDENKREISTGIKTISIQPGDTETLSWTYNFDSFSSSCWYKSIQPSKKSVCENVISYNNVRKSRQVTKYRPVYRERTKKMTATLYEMMTKQAKWYIPAN